MLSGGDAAERVRSGEDEEDDDVGEDEEDDVGEDVGEDEDEGEDVGEDEDEDEDVGDEDDVGEARTAAVNARKLKRNAPWRRPA